MTTARPLLAAALAVDVLLAASIAACADQTPAPATLRVHVPRSVRAEGATLRLGDVAVLQSDDAGLLARCQAIGMGRTPWSGERLVLDRATLAARLATHGVGGDRVCFTGADEVVVTRAEAVTPADAVATAARTFLEKVRPAPAECQWRLIRSPDALTAPAGSQVALTAALAPHHARGEAKVVVTATADGQPVGSAEAVFRLAYPHRRLVAARDIAPGEVVTPENTKVLLTVADTPDSGDWSAPFGGTAVRAIAAGSEILPGLARPPKAEIVVHRNEAVVMRLAGECFTVTALGKALEDGRPGERIRVQNVDSGRIVLARVTHDGAVEPVMAER